LNLDDLEKLLASERIRRIGESEQTFAAKPPDEFISSILASVERWTADRAERHSPQGLIYHYCDAPALFNILNTKKVWATSTKYLNDTMETLALIRNLKDHADRHRNTDAGAVLSDIVDFYLITADKKPTQTIGMDRFACCFSANGDLLSQWRAYGNNGRGYAIGFDPSAFRDLVDPQPKMSLRRITYGGKDEASLVDDLFSRFKPMVEPHLQILDQTGWDRLSARYWLSLRFGECMFDLVEEIKHPAFVEEDEWRLYANEMLYANSGKTVKYRVSQDRIVPFVELELCSSAKPTVMPVAEIVIGPRLDYAEAVMSLTSFTYSLGYGLSMKFKRSTAPYR
jgi:hypothetical protein